MGKNRIDIISSKKFSISRSKAILLIKKGFITYDGKTVKPSFEVDDETKLIKNEPKESITSLEYQPKPFNKELDIVYEDDQLMVINKDVDVVVHPALGHEDDTLVNILAFHNRRLSPTDIKRPGIVHRLDKDTSGLLVVAKDSDTHAFLSSQLQDHTMNREYFALVVGEFEEDEGKIFAPISKDSSNPLKKTVDLKNKKQKEATTLFKVVKRYKGYTLLSCKLLTGRTHQIRVHLNYIGHPVVGDNLYGKNNLSIFDKHQVLFAYRLSFIHPKSMKLSTFEVKRPQWFEDILKKLN